jgi:PAS domain-containing protein
MPRLSQLRFAFGIGSKLYSAVALAFLAVAVLAITAIQMSHRTDLAARHLYQDGLLGSRDAIQLQLLFQQHRRAVESAPAELRRERLAATSKELARLRVLIEQALGVDWSDTPEGIEEHAIFSGHLKAELPAMFRHGDRVLELAANFSQNQALDVAEGPYAAAADKIQTEIQNWRDKRLRISGDEVDTLLRNARVTLYWVSGSVGVAFAFGLVGLMITRGVTRRLDRITRVMVRLAGQDSSVDVPSRDDRDEIGAMARAVEVFKTNAIEVRRNGAELKLTNAQFTAALDNMSQGLCLYDGGERLTVVNRRFREIFGLPDDSVQPGWTMRDVVELSIAAGNHPGRDAGELYDEYVAFIARREAASFHQEIRDGRVVAISHEPAENGGWVATYADVTASRRAEQQIVFMAQHDALTRLPNRVLLRERIGHAVAQAGRLNPAAVLCLDLDHFKSVNDTLGGGRLAAGRGSRPPDCLRPRGGYGRTIRWR